MKKAVVLSGGGAYGAYQVGVWKALKKLNIKYDIVTGTSVGSINGALMVQGDYRKATKIWKNMSFSSLFNEELENDVSTISGKKELLAMFAKNLVTNGGVDAGKLEAQVDKYFDSKKFYSSKTEYGLVTVKLPTLKPIKITKDKLPAAKAKDYIVASATCFPAFQAKEIDKHLYIDGGYRDHLPLELAVSMGATDIIAVDVMGFSKKEIEKHKNDKIVYISPKNNLGSFFGFSESQAEFNMLLGYNDTMKIYGKLEGNKYTFKPTHLQKNLEKHKAELLSTIEHAFSFNKKGNILKDSIFKKTDYYKMLSSDKYLAKTFYSSMEYLAQTFKLNPAEIYSMNKFNNELIKKLNEVDIKRLTTIEKKIETRDVSNLFNSKVIIKYMYEKLNDLGRSKKKRKDISKYAIFLPKEFLSALYLYTVIEKKTFFNIL